MIYRALKKTFQQILLFVLSIYSNYISCFFAPGCRFYPSCSHYAHEAIVTHGSMRGLYMTACRLLRCHPWNPGGFDPVSKTLPASEKTIAISLSCRQHPKTETESPTNT